MVCYDIKTIDLIKSQILNLKKKISLVAGTCILNLGMYEILLQEEKEISVKLNNKKNQYNFPSGLYLQNTQAY